MVAFFASLLQRVFEWTRGISSSSSAAATGLDEHAHCHLSQCEQATRLLLPPSSAHGPANYDLLSPGHINALLGRGPVHLDEGKLHIPIVLGQSGHCQSIYCGLPSGLLDFLEPLCIEGKCRLLVNEKSDGRWTQFIDTNRNEEAVSLNKNEHASIQEIKLHKRRGGLGLSIVAARGAQQPHQGIYIKAVLEGGAAETDGRLEPGDQII